MAGAGTGLQFDKRGLGPLSCAGRVTFKSLILSFTGKIPLSEDGVKVSQ